MTVQEQQKEMTCPFMRRVPQRLLLKGITLTSKKKNLFQVDLWLFGDKTSATRTQEADQSLCHVAGRRRAQGSVTTASTFRKAPR